MIPSEYDLPHDSFRKYQHESILWGFDIGEDVTPRTGIMEAPTGSGKSAIAVAQATKGRTVIVTRTKALQDAYRFYYKVTSLMGKSNYRCVYDPLVSCDECAFKRFSDCPEFDQCLYVAAKRAAIASKLVVVNYALWLSDRKFRELDTETVIYDECHLCRDIAMDWSGCTVTSRDRDDWRLPGFPTIKTVTKETMKTATTWIQQSQESLVFTGQQLRNMVENGAGHLKEKLKKCEHLWRKLESVLEAIEDCPDAWFIRSGPGVLWRNRPVAGFICCPLTAKYHWPRLMNVGGRRILMSATIGDIPTFAASLGITSFSSRVVPNQFEAWQRPVHVLDVPSMSYKSRQNPRTVEKQADAIAGAIRGCPESWAGMIHVTRKTEAPALAKRLIDRGISRHRLWVPPEKDENGRYLGTQDQAELWKEYLGLTSNAITVCWQFWEGYDGLEEKINVSAKIPYAGLSSEYEQEKMKYDRKAYELEAARLLQQSLGRTRRGRPEDYDTETEIRGYCAIADGGLKRIKKKLSPDLTEALVYD